MAKAKKTETAPRKKTLNKPSKLRREINEAKETKQFMTAVAIGSLVLLTVLFWYFNRR
jgi:hypothetical protein